MTSRRIEIAERWLWGSCVAAFLAGIGFGWRHMGAVPPAPSLTEDIPASTSDHLILTHPFPSRPDPKSLPGSLLYTLYPSDPTIETPLAEEVHPFSFTLSDPWLTDLLAKKWPNINNSFAFRMRGQIRFTSKVTYLHIRSDNGYRITFRDSNGHESHLDDWEDSTTEDFHFQVAAEPGCYDVVIDFFNVQGNAYFNLWSGANDIVFYPEEPASVGPLKPGH